MYKETAQSIWQGRTDSKDDLRYFRYHQIVQCSSVDEQCDIGIIGFMCDEGVRRNNGRVGAKEAPNVLRQQLSSIAWRYDGMKKVVDYGNIVCENFELEDAQQQLGNKVEMILNSGKAIILGGGHETLYGQYLGVRQAVGKDASIGLLNIDAHFDIRSYAEQTSSGTMFKQILDADSRAAYFVCGIQQFGNTTGLFETADQYNVTYFLEEQLEQDRFYSSLQTFMDAHDVLIVTLCMDVLSAGEAPGVSAPSPFGLSAIKVREILRLMMAHPKTTSFSICEVNPLLDRDHQTAKLGAYFINEAIMNSIK